LHGLALSWVGTGRLIFSLNYDDEQFAAVVERFVAACVEMKSDGWWSRAPALTTGAIRRGILKEMLRHRF
jgi:glutamate-1-semialdehyde 2,1-aminomutase